MRDLLYTILCGIAAICTPKAALADPYVVYGPTPDITAGRIANEMLLLPRGYEYGAFIMCTSTVINTCWSSDFAYGDRVSISSEENSRIYPADKEKYIVGYIHIHPPHDTEDKEYNLVYDMINISPSAQDYEFAYRIYKYNNKPFTLWIVGHDLRTRAYPLPTLQKETP